MADQSTVSYNVDFLRQSALALARSQSWGVDSTPWEPVRPLLEESRRTLIDAYRTLSLAAKNNHEISPAAEWLIDNFYILQEQIVQVSTDFPRSYQKQIPRLSEGPYQGLPRVYELVLNHVVHMDNMVDLETLTLYVQSYQEQEVLTLGEIWAIPILLRLVLIQELARKAEQLLTRRKARPLVATLVEELGSRDFSNEPGQVLRKLTNWMESLPRNGLDERILLVELASRLQSSGLMTEEEKRWFAFRFNRMDLTLEEAMRREALEQSRIQVSIQNNISSLRTVSEADWTGFGEECSIVDRLLRLDPMGIYPEMDFDTRDRYRNVVERLARHSPLSETEVVEQTLLLAEKAAVIPDGTSVPGGGDQREVPEEGSDVASEEASGMVPGPEVGVQPEPNDPVGVRRHVGYWLVDRGYEELVRSIGYSMPFMERIRRALERHTSLYIGSILLHTMVLLLVLWFVTDSPSKPFGLSVSVLLIALFPALDLSVSSMNRLFAILLPPRILPKMDYREGIPEESRTVVVVPTLIGSVKDLEAHLEQLEVHSLANPDETLQFGLLTDFPDSDRKEREGEEEILEKCRQMVEQLNRRHTSRYGSKFFVCHRERRWNRREGVWMGWERKRGKLEEFNRLLVDSSEETGFVRIFGVFPRPSEEFPVRFVITLDADTRLPPDSARKLVQTAAHPLNLPVRDPEENRIVAGYGIIQPKISIPPDSSGKSWFSRIFSGNTGLDPYSSVVSDIYQDLKAEAIFTGKGIYHVKAFHEVMDRRLPDNRILSHDLLESTYMRAGLATEIELFDDFPGTYMSYCHRSHRWTRGDWQIAAWLGRRVPGREGRERNPINLLSRWKIFDNLRRSLNPFFLLLFFITGWFWLPGSPLIWTLAAFGILAFPIYVSLSSDIANRPARVKWQLYLEKVRANLRVNSLQAFSRLVMLPHQAALQLDAILRTCWRLGVTGEKLLEWRTASHMEKAAPNSWRAYLELGWFSVLTGGAVLAAAVIFTPTQWGIPLLFSLLWIGMPLYFWYVSQPIPARQEYFGAREQARLRGWARRTWFYFERLAGEEHSWLPPDNYQIDPHLPPAPRTSPTNIGLLLVSTQTAFNMGYLSLGRLLDRVERTLGSVELLEKYKGHLFNWYETRTGQVLNPRYVSTVDSGNLAASLITLKEALLDNLRNCRPTARLWDGLTDTVRSVREVFDELRREAEQERGRREADRNGKFHPFGDAWPGRRERESGTDEDTDLVRGLFRKVESATGELLRLLEEPAPVTAGEALERLDTLKRQALMLCAIDLLPLRKITGDELLVIYRYWTDAPLTAVEEMKREWSLLRAVDGFRIGEHTLPQLMEMARRSEADEVLQELGRWRRQIRRIVSLAEQLVREMDFSFLYNHDRGLFHIGYNTEKAQLDLSTYDLLASEARIASYVAIAKGDVPAEHWFRLSRRLTRLGRDEILLSWGGTMFEYLMPTLFMRSFPETLLSHTSRSVVEWQMRYAQKRGYPWGSSESAYHFLNLELHFQYRAFGSPGLGLKRGLADEYVIAPYATLLALMVEPHESLRNLERIVRHGGLGPMGFYDAIDYTPARLPPGQNRKVVRTWMAHHHGMSLLALDNVLNDWPLHRYFHSDPAVMGCDLLLQEKIPRGVPIKEPHPIDVELEPGEQETIEYVVEHAGMEQIDISPPRLHLLSNGRYSLFVTHAGTGSSSHEGRALTSWEADPTADPLGLFIYIRDLESGEFWSAGHQPVRRRPDRYDTWFHQGKVVTSRVDDWIETTMEICVSSERPLELRRIILTNYSERERKLEITSYAEVVLNRLKDHRAHPAFSKLFVQTDYADEHHAVLARRRPRSSSDREEWLIHTVTGHDLENVTRPLQFETDRARFIGRGRTLSDPQAMDPGNELSGFKGNVSDPIVSLRRSVTIEGGGKVEIVFGLGWAASREEAIRLADISDNPQAVDREFDLATIYSMVELEHLDISPVEAHWFQKLASWMLYPDRAFRVPERKIRQNRKGQQGLWAYGISGDLPLLVFRIREMEQMGSIRTLFKARSFWREKGVDVDLVILNDHPPSYADELEEEIRRTMETTMKGRSSQMNGGIHILKSDHLPEEDLTLILSAAHALFEGRLPLSGALVSYRETLSFDRNTTDAIYEPSQVGLRTADGNSAGEPEEERIGGREGGAGGEPEQRGGGDAEETGGPAGEEIAAETDDEEEELIFFNGFGGFGTEGREYHIQIVRNPRNGYPVLPPAPWINVIANPSAGFLCSERGAGYTWSVNSRENKLTGWSNDPVCDPFSEALYIRDEKSRRFWSPHPGPVPGEGEYRVAHGFGYSRFEHHSAGLEQRTTHFMAGEDPVRITLLELRNRTLEEMDLSLFTFCDLVMGVEKRPFSRFILPQALSGHALLMATNPWNNEFAGSVLFHSMAVRMAAGEGDAETELTYTTDRSSFIGRNRSPERPAALLFKERLDNRSEAGGDPCLALHSRFRLGPGEQCRVIILTGEAKNGDEAMAWARRYSEPSQAAGVLEKVKKEWSEALGRIQVRTPDPSLDLMVNGWLMYQNLACRLFARSAFYQAGGAFGYRDQLQDVMAALYVDPQIARKQILLHASRQFPEGDVQHWWHPPTGRGIRSRITDDRLWLPYVTDFYIRSTGDRSILDEQVPWITTRPLRDDEHEVYLEPEPLEETDPLFEHCCRAIEISMKTGRHGLPLIGSGDWNDGMNRVGEDGKGESVWLGFFLYDILNRFTEISESRGESQRARRYRKEAERLKKKLNEEGWDGSWYLRAFYDDGTPLGSSRNEECRIDTISQAWSVISGVAPEERIPLVLQALEKHLISEEIGIIRLLTPAFDRTERDPGYIRGYIPGVRENGGQYTHGALWAVRAFAEAGEGERAAAYLQMINPVNHGRTPEEVSRYKVEPYVVAADVYGEPPLQGQGGWTWYTGSGAWMYRVALESILGFRLEGDRIALRPAIPGSWQEYFVEYDAGGGTRYRIRIRNPEGVQTGMPTGTLDGEPLSEPGMVPLIRDGREHKVELVLRRAEREWDEQKKPESEK